MCLIVDANTAALVFSRPATPEFAPIHRWLAGEGRIVVGGRLLRELGQNHKVLAALAELNKSGRTLRISDEEVSREETWVTECGDCTSDDPHVLGLARASGARTLCTHDAALADDFRNLKVVPAPKGRIYKRQQHKRLLIHSRGCAFTRRRLKRRRRHGSR